MRMSSKTNLEKIHHAKVKQSNDSFGLSESKSGHTVPFEREPPEGEDAPADTTTQSSSSKVPYKLSKTPSETSVEGTNQEVSGVSMDSWHRAQSWAAGLFKPSDGRVSSKGTRENYLSTPLSRPNSSGTIGLDSGCNEKFNEGRLAEAH